MQINVFKKIVCCVGVLLFLSFRSTINIQEPWKAPSWTDTLRNPYTVRVTSDLRVTKAWGARVEVLTILQEGEKMYNMYCMTCHGKNGLGDAAPGMTFTVKPTNFHDKVVTDQKDGALFWKMSEGRGLMPAYKDLLSDDKRWTLVTYIRQLSTQTNVATFSKNLLAVTGFTIDPKMVSQYFPLPAKVRNVVSSESQLFMVDTVVSGLTRPWSMTFLPDKSVLIAERSGKLLRVINGKVQEKPIGGNIPKELRDVKLDPQFEKNGLIYISYYIDPVRPNGGYTALMRARLDGDKLVEDKVLYKAGPFTQTAFWYGSKITFDREGYLYFTVGITGARENAQDLSNPAGKIMRFNHDGSIPSNNPFVHTAGALPEIYSYGHRFPEGLKYDPKTNKIWSTEFGEMRGDELNIIKPGANYGWPVVTFSVEYTGKIISKDSLRADIEPPIHHFYISPSDLDFVYGNRYPAWDGNIFIGGLPTKMLLRNVIKNNVFIHDEELLQNIGRVRDVKYGPDKFLYAMTEDTGLIVRLVPVSKKVMQVQKIRQ